MNVGTDEAEKFKTDLDLDGRVNSVEPTDHHHDQDDNNDYNDDDDCLTVLLMMIK